MLHEFHEQYIEEMLICGVDKPGTPLDKIKMTKNPKYDLGYYKKIVGGIQKFDPFCKVVARVNSENILADMNYVYLNNNKDIRGIFLLQNVYNWDGKNLFSAQVWGVKNISEDLINQYWLVDYV
jgi:hypothetical protein